MRQVPVLVVPSTLHFSEPPNVHQAHVLTLYNPYSLNFLYKISCTAPAIYVVQPNAGSIPRNSQVQVLVKIKPPGAAAAAALHAHPSSAASSSSSSHASAPYRGSNRDKFLVELIEEHTRVVRGKQIIGVEYSNSAAASAAAAVPAAWTNAASAAHSAPALSSRSSSSAKHASSHSSPHSSPALPSAATLNASSKWSSVSLPLRLLPLLLGTILVGLIAAGEIVVTRQGVGVARGVGGGGGGGGAATAAAAKTAAALAANAATASATGATAADATLCADDPLRLWLCFCIGLITSALQMKFFDL